MSIRHRAVLVSAVAALAVSLPSVSRAQSPTPVVDRAVAAWKKVRALSGTFEQTVTNQLVRTTTTARGEFRQQLPNKLAVRFTNPAGDAIVADGQFLWVYLQQAAPGQVMKRPMSDQMAMPLDIGQFLNAPASRYDIVLRGAETVNGRKTQVLNLTPRKGTSAPFTRATVWVDDTDSLIRQFEVMESGGLTRRIQLLTIVVNPALGPSDFKFSVPKGVKVIGGL